MTAMNPHPHDTLRPETLAQIELAIWQDLSRAVADRHHPWRTPSLLTTDLGQPDGRVVVLRGVDVQARTLVFYTDARTPKVRQIKAQPGGMLLFWNPRRSWQLRARCSLGMQTSGPQVDAAWDKVKNSRAAGDYLSALVPGQTLAGEPPAATAQAPATPHHLAIISAQLDSLDWLELAPAGHRRAGFSSAGAVWRQC